MRMPKLKRYIKGRTVTKRHALAEYSKKRYTKTEKNLENGLKLFYSGFLADKFEREWVVAGRYRLDFFFHESRLGIEVDGSIHNTTKQIKIDKLKNYACKKMDIHLLRFSNRQVLYEIEEVVKKIYKAHRYFVRKNKENDLRKDWVRKSE